MAKQKIMKVGNSLCVTVPAHFVQSVGIRPGEQVVVETSPEKGTVIYKFSGSKQLPLAKNLLQKRRRRKPHRKKTYRK